MDEKPQQPPSKQKQSSHNKPQQPQNQIQIPSWQSKAFEEWVKTLLMQDIVDSGISVLELYCGKGMDIGKWHRSQISSYVGLETNKNHLDASKQRWNEKGKPFEAEFMNLDPLNSNFVDQLPTTKRQFNVICCFQGLGNSFETQEKVTNLLKNISNLLKPKGIFFGIVLDSSAVWYKAAGHGLIDKEKLYSLEFENELFTSFGTKYTLKMEGLEDQIGFLVHFPSLIKIARETKLKMLDISNFNQFYEDRKRQNAELLSKMNVFTKTHPNFHQDQKTVIGLFATFVFQKE